jgi:hypothetical protein
MNRLTRRDRIGGACIKPLDPDCGSCGSDARCKDHWSQIADRLAAYEDTGLEPDEIPSWIDAEDETPDIGQTVLVYLPDKEEEKIRVGEYLGEGDYRIGRKVYRGYEIGAWMPLLRPPKEEK